MESYLKENLSVAPDGNGGYSNLAFGLLGYTLGSRFDTIGYAASLRQRVLDPLGMEHTSFGIDSTRSHLVQGLNPNGSPATFWTFTEAMGSAGAIVSTARDMARFLRAQLDSTLAPLALTRERHGIYSGTRPVGLGWQILYPNAGYTVYWHNGAVGGYRSFIAIDTEHERGAVLLTNVLVIDETVDRAGLALAKPTRATE